MKHVKTAFSVFCLLLLGGFLFVWLRDEVAFREELKERSAPTTLHPIVEEKKNELVGKAAEAGIDILITDDFRSIDAQNKLHRQGRSEAGRIITHAEGGESYHNYGLAIDFALRLPDGNVVWDVKRDGNGNGKADWLEVADIAKELGFSWGGDWRSFKDYPHLEMNFGLSIEDLQKGWRPEDVLE